MTKRLPPAGAVLSARNVWGATAGLITPACARKELAGALREVLGDKEVFLVSSGRAALYLTLGACRSERGGGRDAVISAYTCWTVAAAALRAGLRLHLVDIDPETLDFADALERSSPEDPLALITHNLFGLPNDPTRAAAVAAAWGSRFIDDAAQGLGAEIHGKKVGDEADAIILSFGRGKALPALAGGAVLVPKGNSLARSWKPPARGKRGGASFLRASAYGIFFSRAFYRYPAGLPFLRLGETIYDERFPVREADGYSARLAARLLSALGGESESRRKAAAEYDEMIRSLPGLKSVQPLGGARGTYLRYPLRVPREKRDAVLRATGHWGVSSFYPGPIHRIPGLPDGSVRWSGSLRGSEELAQTLVTLPTHSLVTAGERAGIVEAIQEACR